MKKRKLAGASLALAAVIGLTLGPVVTAPASAAVIPTLYTLGYNDNHLYSIDPATGIPTDLGATGITDPNISAGPGINPKDGKVYVATLTCDIWVLDIPTHTGTLLGSLTGTFGGLPIDSCYSEAFDGDGTMWISVEQQAPNPNEFYLGTVDLSTLVATQVGSSQPYQLSGMWFTPTDGVLHGLQYGGGNLVTVNTTTGAYTTTGQTRNSEMYGVVADDSGTYYANGWTDLSTGPLSDYSSAASTSAPNAYSIPGGMALMFSTTNYWPAPPTPPTPDSAALPNTGVSVASGLTAAITLLGLGIGVVTLVIRRRKVNA